VEDKACIGPPEGMTSENRLPRRNHEHPSGAADAGT
jgi:hypothetical protein